MTGSRRHEDRQMVQPRVWASAKEPLGVGAPASIPLVGLTLLLGLGSGCCRLADYQTPEGILRWQDTSPPQLSLAEKAAGYQQRLEARFQTPEGLLQYRRIEGQDDESSYGALADGCFHSGIYLASQALRYATTGEPEARKQLLLTLNALSLLMEVTGRPGLLARHFSPVGTRLGGTWYHSETHPEYQWKGDVSKDQYAGFIFGLGVTLAVVREPDITTQVAHLATAAADHLRENDLYIVDIDGEATTYGNLHGRICCIPIGVNALIVLAIAKVAAESSGDPEYTAFYQQLVDAGYPQITHWAYFSLLGFIKRVNDNMGYLALYPLLLLETDPEILAELRNGERRTWAHVQDEHNAFFAFVHGALVGDSEEAFAQKGHLGSDAGKRGVKALDEFPVDKVQWPVDLTREGFDFPQRFLNSKNCLPRSTRAIPLHLRSRSSSFWASDPYRLVDDLDQAGEIETAGVDYLQAYWMGRYHGFVDESEVE